MNETELRAEYQRAPALGTEHGGCPDTEQMHELVERKGDEAERLKTLDHAMSCSRCRTEFELLRAIRVSRPRSARNYVRPLALAASLALVIGAGSIWLAVKNGTDADVMRGGSEMLELIAPIGSLPLDSRLEFSWYSAPGEVRYAILVLSESGSVEFAGVTRDTGIALPDTVSLLPGSEYRWWVVARFVDGSEVASPIETFRVSER